MKNLWKVLKVVFPKMINVAPFLHKSFGLFNWLKPFTCNENLTLSLIMLSQVKCCWCCTHFLNIGFFFCIFSQSLCSFKWTATFYEASDMFSTSSPIGDGLHIIFTFNLWWKEFIMLSSNVRKVPGLSTSLNLWFTASISVTTLSGLSSADS